MQGKQAHYKVWLWWQLALLAALLVLFPFDWLGHVWPAYAAVFAVVFATALAHEIGHVTVFLLAGLAVLGAFAGVRRRPVLYLAIMVLGALGEELLQSLFKQSLPDMWDRRDLLLDLLGFLLAYGLVILLLFRSRVQMSKDRSSHEKKH